MRRCSRWWMAVALVLGLGVGCAHVSGRPTQPGWMLFPRSQDGVLAQSPMLWPGHAWGRADVHRALLAATADVRKRHPEARVEYLDVSRRRGGRFFPHLSHRGGSDVDVMYLTRGRPPALGYLVKYERNRRAGFLRFDADRNWEFIVGLRRQRHARVAKIFVEPYIEEWLLEAGRAAGASAAELRWAKGVLRWAGPNAADHKDHMHIRFAD